MAHLESVTGPDMSPAAGKFQKGMKVSAATGGSSSLKFPGRRQHVQMRHEYDILMTL
jgi:hypothetical protein